MPKGMGPNINRFGATGGSKGISAGAEGSLGISTGAGGTSRKPGGIGSISIKYCKEFSNLKTNVGICSFVVLCDQEFELAILRI